MMTAPSAFSYASVPMSARCDSRETGTSDSDVVPYPPSIQLRGISFGRRLFQLKEAIQLGIEYEPDQGWVVVEYRPLSILSGAETLAGALESFREDFAMLWDTIAQESSEALSGDAKLLKKQMQQMVKHIASAA